jgi:CMP-N-acetylneuraminic acid synthetase
MAGVIGIVPARSGSKGFPGKNIAEFAGMPLLVHAVRSGISSGVIDEVYVSTDSPVYERMAKESGAKSLGLRPAELAADDVKTVDVILDLLRTLKPEVVVLLQPTAPLRTTAEIRKALTLLGDSCDAVVSVARIEEPHPNKAKRISAGGYLVPFIESADSERPRQMLPPAYRLTGEIYAIKADILKAAKTFLPSRTCALIKESLSVNIDLAEDLEYLNFRLSRGNVALPEWVTHRS